MLVLGIESSCDETSAAIVEDGVHVLSNVISTSRKDFERLAGVIPEQAARRQLESIIGVLQQSLFDAQCTIRDMDMIAVTRGPGLLGSLLVGTCSARVLSSVFQVPLMGVHHTLGHLSSPWLNSGLIVSGDGPKEPQFPILTLSVSGGHTDLWYRESHTASTLVGRTRDDAAGEAFDKGASMLGLPYPGGPPLSKAAQPGSRDRFHFGKPLHDDPSLDFSFSGLKTALKYTLRDLDIDVSKKPLSAELLSDICASYEHALCTHLSDRLERALHKYPAAKEVHIVGGVSANTYLRNVLSRRLADVCVRVPSELRYCTDNAAMIAAAGYFLRQSNIQPMPFITQASLSHSSVTSAC